ncbi:rho guanine nucleotide exchange factor 8-like [Salvia miltiorrhiza]|uniref:rho guanine nucleotide exchange factor 8-like n=1 Tax=Salvia miltiorrhiza TaxID=226208 RepID=UPI0025ABA331|nr:rho guanine nucleotide exchange factor 8-like [Salvia miltiorrhiza]
MVKAMEEAEDQESSRSSRLGRFRGMLESGASKFRRSLNDNNTTTNGSASPLPSDEDNERMTAKSNASAPLPEEPAPPPVQLTKLGGILSRTENVKMNRTSSDGTPTPASAPATLPATTPSPTPAPTPKTSEAPPPSPPPPVRKMPTDMDLMKEKFAKLLLGEDMSGRGKGVSSALALSNAITNLAASAYGEMKKLEPMAPDTKAKWKKEIDWLLSVTDHIVEFVAVKQKNKDGTTFEVMATRQRNDLHMNIPALRKLDMMLLDCLDNFKEPHEFYYGSKDDDKGDKAQRNDDKWWIPVPKVPPNGLSENTRKWLQYQKDSVNQVLKAAMAINAQVLTEMEIPETYIEALPKNGRASLGDSIYKMITEDFFDPDYLLSSLDLSSEHKIVDLKNKIEASVVIWKRKINAKDTKSSWGSGVSMEKRELLEDRAETVLLILKHRFPGIPQSDLDISKIEFNKDVGHAVLESYSRILETLAFTVLSRIEDVMSADAQARGSANAEKTKSLKERTVSEKVAVAKEETESETPNSKTLLDFMGWNVEQQGETDGKKANDENADAKTLTKQENIVPNKKLSYIERLEILGGSRSPTARH